MSFIQKPKRSSSASKKLPQDTSLRSSWRSNANANQNTPLGLSMLPKEKKTSQIPYYISLFTINIRPDFISGLLKIEERISYYHYETMDHHTRTIHCPNMKITNLTVTAEDTVVSIDKEVWSLNHPLSIDEFLCICDSDGIDATQYIEPPHRSEPMVYSSLKSLDTFYVPRLV
eukprot:TRINITY_DN1959_c0_g1_i1.p1 TRINITY_DN1959_c0_g1~~TRINITY_DN1959_c0_g1_i1.p1  ORF type:complete len:173 (+),score=22.86 TRINITY_DN1959_c0_g1_i1:53-571(+)